MQCKVQSDRYFWLRLGRMSLTAVIAAIMMTFGLNASSAQEGDISIELNKLEPQGGQCRAYFVINNKSGTDYEALKLDLVLFKPDNVIGKRFAIDLAPLKASKRSVKLFDIEGTPCEEVGSFLINEAMECRAASGPVDDCLKGLTLSSLTQVQLTK
jgi:hypothetical protein